MYEDMSDAQLNSKLFDLITNGCAAIIIPDYCNSWADIGPLIDEHNVTLIQDTEVEYPEDPQACIIDHTAAGGHMGIFEFCGEHVSQAKTPLRAAVICIIKKLESEL